MPEVDIGYPLIVIYIADIHSNAWIWVPLDESLHCSIHIHCSESSPYSFKSSSNTFSICIYLWWVGSRSFFEDLHAACSAPVFLGRDFMMKTGTFRYYIAMIITGRFTTKGLGISHKVPP